MAKQLRRARRKLVRWLFLAGLLAGALFAWQWMKANLSPLGEGNLRYVRFDERTSMEAALQRLQDGKLIRSAFALRLYGRLTRKPSLVAPGTYRLGPKMDGAQILGALAKPIHQMVRIPETNFSYRTARLLERENVCRASDYLALVFAPAKLKAKPSFPVPVAGLEGYLYPDTYELPPMLGAEGVVKRQLDAFKKKVVPLIPPKTDLNHVLTVASMVELEVQKDNERALVAGVIENRIRLGMRLQIDATINYALKEWRPLTRTDLKLDSPFNTYRVTGLPPTPICSPTVKSIQAALKPAKHNYLYYVALPDGSHLFSATYDEHRKNIQKRKAALAR